MVKNQRIPFKISYINHGFAEVKGLLHINDNQLLIEFEKQDTLVGLMKSGVKQVSIPFSEIESVIYKKKWIGAVIEIQGRSMKVFDAVPGAEQGFCKLKIRRKHRREAERAVSSARVHLSEYRLKELEDD